MTQIYPNPQWMWVYGKNMIFNNGKQDLVIPVGTEFLFTTEGPEYIPCGKGVVIAAMPNQTPLMKFSPIYGDDVYSDDRVEGALSGQKIMCWAKFPPRSQVGPGFPPHSVSVPLQHETDIVWNNYTGFELKRFTVGQWQI